jgi:DNA (cytosine-5)-methyltransferase 1
MPKASINKTKSSKTQATEAPTFLDLFAGAGGLSTGLELAGFNLQYANELSPAFSETLRANHPGALISVEDIRSISPAEIMKQIGFSKGQLDLVAGGPPCQGFSINAPVRSTEDHRNHLFWNFLGFVECFDPKFVLIENVPGMLSFNNGETVRAILKSLEKLGYKATVRILAAPHYGIPQMRWRTVFLATRLDLDPQAMYPPPTCKSSVRANFTSTLDGQSLILDVNQRAIRKAHHDVTVWDAISDLPPIMNGGGEIESSYQSDPQSDLQKILRKDSLQLFNHQAAGLGPANLVRLPHIPPGGSWRDIPHDLLPDGMKKARRSDHTKRYGRLHPEGIASTILTKCDPHWGSYIHPTQDRIISVREAARLQSFPDKVRFYGNLVEQYKQVGNAVPPLLGKALGDRIQWCLSRIHSGKKPVADVAVTGNQLKLEISLG